MLTKDFIELRKTIPFAVEKVKNLGDVGIRLMRDGDLEEIEDFEVNKQIAWIIIDKNGCRVFSDDDIELVKLKFARPEKMDIISAWRKANYYEVAQAEIKKG